MIAWATSGTVFVVIFVTMLILYGKSKKREGINEEKKEQHEKDIERIQRAHRRLQLPAPAGINLVDRWRRRMSEHKLDIERNTALPRSDDCDDE